MGTYHRELLETIQNSSQGSCYGIWINGLTVLNDKKTLKTLLRWLLDTTDKGICIIGENIS